MTGERAKLFDPDSDDTIDVSGFAPKQPAPAAALTEVRAVSEAAQFRSRESPPSTAMPPATARPPRRYRTGRNVQLNIKARAEAIAAFYAIADRQGWVLGEAFERAIEALERDLTGAGS